LRSTGAGGPGFFFDKFGILENPFGSTPNPRYLYRSRSHAEARASLIVGLECGLGFQALIAPPGMGKTTILFDVLERFNRVAHTAFLFQLQGDARDFLHYLILELGSEVRDSDLLHIQDAINRLLIKERRSGRRTIIVIDEAQTLSSSVLETVRLLSNFETPTEKLLQIVLAGQPQLAQQLATPELTQLHQRISIIKTLVPLDLEETKNYVEYRLKVAGYQGQPLFTSAALRSIWETSHGIPREINTICFNALLLLAAAGGRQVDLKILQEVIADLEPVEISGNAGRPPGPRFTEQVAKEAPKEHRTAPRVRVDDPRHAFPPAHMQFYDFSRNPFEPAPNPSFLCFTSTHSAALASLYSGIFRNEGLLLLTGEAGTGKSLVAACLMEILKCGHIAAEYVLGRHLSPCETLTSVGEFDSISSRPARDVFRMEPATYFEQESGRKLTVLLVDEAQDLSMDALREIQLLAGLQSPRQRLPQIILLGRPEVDQRLNCDEFRQMRGRIATHHQLKSLDEPETAKYIACRLRLARESSLAGPIFREDALAAVCCRSRGIPRLINLLCEGALIRAHALRQREITSAIIDDVAKQPPADLGRQEKIPQDNAGDTSDILKAARVLLEFHAGLQGMRS